MKCPKKASDEDYVYTFSGWTPEITAVTGDVTYTAVYDKFAIIHEDDVFVNSTDGNPEILVSDCRTGAVLTENTDYTLEITPPQNNSIVGTVVINGIGSYTGEATKRFAVLNKALTSTVSDRKKSGPYAKATLSGTWSLPTGSTNIKGGIARVYTGGDDNFTKYDIYNNGIKKTATIKTTSFQVLEKNKRLVMRASKRKKIF